MMRFLPFLCLTPLLTSCAGKQITPTAWYDKPASEMCAVGDAMYMGNRKMSTMVAKTVAAGALLDKYAARTIAVNTRIDTQTEADQTSVDESHVTTSNIRGSITGETISRVEVVENKNGRSRLYLLLCVGDDSQVVIETPAEPETSNMNPEKEAKTEAPEASEAPEAPEAPEAE